MNDILYSPSLLPAIASLFLGASALSGLLFLLLPPLRARMLPRPRRTTWADLAPLERLHPDGATILAEGRAVRVWRIHGAELIYLRPGAREAHFQGLLKWIDSLSRHAGAEIRVHHLRRPLETAAAARRWRHPLTQRIAETWQSAFARAFTTEHYISIAVKTGPEAARELTTLGTELEATLTDYRPELLVEPAFGPDEPIDPARGPAAFYARLLNPLSRPSIRGRGHPDLADHLFVDTAEFGVAAKTGGKPDPGLVRFEYGSRRKYMAVLGIQRLGEYALQSTAIRLLALPFEIQVLHTILPESQLTAQHKLQVLQRLVSFSQFSLSAGADFSKVIEFTEAGDDSAQTVAGHSLAIFLFGDSPDELAEAERAVQALYAPLGYTVKREGAVAETCWLAQMPGRTQLPRGYLHLSGVIATGLPLQRPNPGIANSDWAPGPIALFPTVSGEAYSYQYHISDRKEATPHVLVLGPTESGKTTLQCFLAAMASGIPGMRIFLFDRHQGCEVATKALGGTYLALDGSLDSIGLNPIGGLADTAENRKWQRSFLKLLAGLPLDGNDPDTDQEIAEAIGLAYDLPPRDRTLLAMYKPCFRKDGAMRRGLLKWIEPEQYGSVFNAPEDGLAFDRQISGFDMTDLYQDPHLAAAVLSYLMWRVRNVATGTAEPSLVFVDETEPMLRNPTFARWFKEGLQEARKKRQAYVCCFQRPRAVEESGFGDAIRGQCQTVIFYRHPNAEEDEYKGWDLTDDDRAFIRGLSHTHLPRAILVKKYATGQEPVSVVLDADLSRLGDLLQIFASGSRNVRIAREVIARHGGRFDLDDYLSRIALIA